MNAISKPRQYPYLVSIHMPSYILQECTLAFICLQNSYSSENGFDEDKWLYMAKSLSIQSAKKTYILNRIIFGT